MTGANGQAIGADGFAISADGLPTGAGGDAIDDQPTDIYAGLMADHMRALQGSATAGVNRTGHRLPDVNK